MARCTVTEIGDRGDPTLVRLVYATNIQQWQGIEFIGVYQHLERYKQAY